MKQLLVFLEEEFLYLKKYKMSSFIWPFLAGPIITVLDMIFRSEYVKLVEFYTKYVPYLYILFIGGAASSIFVDLSYRFGYTLLDPNLLKDFHLFNKTSFFLSKVLFHIIKESVKVFIIFWPFMILYKLSFNFYLFSILALFLVIPFSLSISLIISSLVLRFKRDAEPLMWVVESIAGLIFPLSFSILIFPEPLRTYLEIFIPSFAIIEEIRKLLILGTFNFYLLISAIFISFTYLFLSIILFIKVYNKGRREGWIYLR